MRYNVLVFRSEMHVRSCDALQGVRLDRAILVKLQMVYSGWSTHEAVDGLKARAVQCIDVVNGGANTSGPAPSPKLSHKRRWYSF